MAERKLPTRAAILAAGCIMFLFTGTIYAWSILSSPFPVEFGWTSAQLGLNFTIVMSCFCIGGLAGSFVTRRLSARVTVLIGAVMCFWAISSVPASPPRACGCCIFPTAGSSVLASASPTMPSLAPWWAGSRIKGLCLRRTAYGLRL